MKNTYWQSYKSISAILALLVIYIHVYNMSEYGITSGFIFLFCSFISSGIARVAVPMFFCLAGINCIYNLNSMGAVKDKVIKRMKSLGIPYLIWIVITWFSNAIPMLFPAFRNNMNGTLGIEWSLYSFFKVIVFADGTSLWFLNRYIICILLLPIIYLVLKKRGAFVLLVAVLIMYNMIYISSEYCMLRVLVYFLVGCYLGKYHQNLLERSYSIKQSMVFGIILLFLAFVEMMIIHLGYYKYEIPIILAMIPAFWTSFSNINMIRSLQEYSFWLYLTHGIPLVIAKKCIFLLFSHSMIVAAVEYFLLPICLVILLVFIGIRIKKGLPTAYAILTGGR